jgi:iron complex transport system substrate-binding protein
MGASGSKSHRRAIAPGFLLLVCALARGALAAAPIVLFDSAHHEQRFAQPPERIASLVPALTETICELNECHRLVVVDRYSNWPKSVALLPKAGGLEDVDVEQIVSARPDVVLVWNDPRVEQRLRSLGLVVFELETETYADIGRNVSVLGAMLGVPQRAERLNRQIEHSVEEIAAATRAHLSGHAPLVYFEVDPAPYGAGPQSFMGRMLGRVGARNILPASLGPFPRLNPEYVVRANPDVILVSAADASQLVHRPGWDQIRAVRESRICTFPPAVRDTIVRPGPRVAEGFQALSQCLLRMAP